MFAGLIGFVRRFRAEMRRVNRLSRARQDQLRWVAAHADDFIDRDLSALQQVCGPYDSATSFDFGDWVAEWHERKVRLSAYVRKERCAEIRIFNQ